MDKVSFKYLYSFTYNKKTFLYLTSLKYPFYILEYNRESKKCAFPDAQDFFEIYELFQNNNGKLCFSAREIVTLAKEKIQNIKLDFAPKVRTVSGLLALSLALFLCGCTARTSELPNIPETSTSALSESLDTMLDYFNSYGIHVSKRTYNNEDYYFVNDCYTQKGNHQITLTSLNDFKEYVGLEKSPTYDDVKNALEENSSIDEDKKEIILKGLKKMEASKDLKRFDLSVLYTNIKRMKFTYLSSEELTKTVNRKDAYAYFETETGTVYLPSDKNFEEFEFLHEVLGHGSLAYRNRTDGELVIYDCTNDLMLNNGNNYMNYSMGIMVSEGGANIVAHIALPDSPVHTFYELYEEELRLISEFCGTSIGEMLNHKGIELCDLMAKNNINNPANYIMMGDGIINGYLYGDFALTLENLAIDATEEKYLETSNKEDVLKATLDIIRNSSFKDGLSFAYPGGSIDYNPKESSEVVENYFRGK